MRLTGIEAREMLSFETLALTDLPERALLVVGPNGAGKTNLCRLVEVVLAAINRSSDASPETYASLARFAKGRRFRAAPAEATSIGLGVALTEAWETDLVHGFVRAALVSDILRDAPSNVDATDLLAWTNEIDADQLAPLTQGTIVADLGDASTGQWSLGYEFEANGDRFRWVLDGTPPAGAIVRCADVPSTVQNYVLANCLELNDQKVPRSPFSLDRILPPPGEARTLRVEGRPLPALEPVRAWAEQAAIPIDATQGRMYGPGWIFHVLFDRGLTMLGDLRQPPAFSYSVTEASFDPSPSDGTRVPLRLFRLKNGDAADRDRFAAVQALFADLTGATFDVTLATPTHNARDESPTTLFIAPVVRVDGRDLPVELAGAGIWEALLLSATLADSAGCVTVLDEPARNLHPTLQRRLLAELSRAPGQFIVTTHSPYLVPIGDDVDLASIVRLDLAGGVTRASRLATARDSDGGRLQKVLAASADARALLFAHGVVLVEGDTELGALPEWFAKSTTATEHGTPDALNLAVFSVGGDTSFGTFVRYLHGLGVTWAIVCDGSIFRFGTRKAQVFEQLVKAGVADQDLGAIVASPPASLTFADARAIGMRHGVLTTASDWDGPAESFEAFMDNVAPGQLEAAEEDFGKSKPRKARHVAMSTDCPGEINSLYASILGRFGIVSTAAASDDGSH